MDPDTIHNTEASGNNSITELSLNNSTAEIYYNEAAGYIVDVISVLIAVVAFYIFVAQVFYLAMRSKVRKDSTGNYRTAFHVLCVFAALSTFLRVVIPVHLAIRGVPDSVCNSIYDFKVIMYFFAYFSLWTILWLRQRYFYNSSTLRDLYSTFIKVISNGVEVIVFLGAAAGTIQYFPERSYHETDKGCIEDLNNTETYIWAIDFSFMFVTQLTLLALFVYPLWKHKKLGQDGKVQRKNNSLNKAIIRATVILGICMVISLACIPITYLLASTVPFVFDLPYDVSLVMQLLAEIALFKNWKKRIFPWMLASRKHRLAKSRRSTMVATYRINSSFQDSPMTRESKSKSDTRLDAIQNRCETIA